ncbi:MAG: ABC transporter substrate-binding protein [Oscillospiraceae bacterium]|jgi:spermidine/putrescine transport system substrate-binding protein|nr:ABC transporter substrate-binding protein [Oscillospiraceae bacterium]
MIILLAALTLLLTSCKPAGSPNGGGNAEPGSVNVFNWGEYMDENLNEMFTQQTGIEVNYNTYPNNEVLYSTLVGGGSSYDVIIPSDYMISRMIDEDLIQQLDFGNIPNFENIDPDLKNPAYDPENLYSVPYAWGTVGIIYDKTRVSAPVDSWSALFDKQYSGQILMFDNSRDAFGIALKLLGYSFNTTDEGKLREAFNLLLEQKPLVQAHVMDQIFDKMENGEAILAPYYAGDALTMMDANENLAFAFPKEGTNVFVDAFCIPKGAANKAAAEAYINFMCSYEPGLSNIDVTGYSTPLLDVYESLDEEIKNDGISYPTDMSGFETFTNLPEWTLSLYNELWIELFK